MSQKQESQTEKRVPLVDSAGDVLERAGRDRPRLRLARHELPRDRRERARLRFDCPVRWSVGRSGVDRFGLARDVSEAGAGFTVRAISRPTVGEQIQLVLELDDDQEWIVEDRALVTRCDPRSDGLYDIGVRLREIQM